MGTKMIKTKLIEILFFDNIYNFLFMIIYLMVIFYI